MAMTDMLQAQKSQETTSCMACTGTSDDGRNHWQLKTHAPTKWSSDTDDTSPDADMPDDVLEAAESNQTTTTTVLLSAHNTVNTKHCTTDTMMCCNIALWQ